MCKCNAGEAVIIALATIVCPVSVLSGSARSEIQRSLDVINPKQRTSSEDDGSAKRPEAENIEIISKEGAHVPLSISTSPEYKAIYEAGEGARTDDTVKSEGAREAKHGGKGDAVEILTAMVDSDLFHVSSSTGESTEGRGMVMDLERYLREGLKGELGQVVKDKSKGREYKVRHLSGDTWTEDDDVNEKEQTEDDNKCHTDGEGVAAVNGPEGWRRPPLGSEESRAGIGGMSTFVISDLKAMLPLRGEGKHEIMLGDEGTEDEDEDDDACDR